MQHLGFAGGPLNQHPVTMDIAHQNGQNVQTHAPASRVCSAAMTVTRWPTSQAKAQAMDDILVEEAQKHRRSPNMSRQSTSGDLGFFDDSARLPREIRESFKGS